MSRTCSRSACSRRSTPAAGGDDESCPLDPLRGLRRRPRAPRLVEEGEADRARRCARARRRAAPRAPARRRSERGPRRSLGALDGAAALVYVLAGEPTEEDERALRSAATAGVPIIAAGPGPDDADSERARDRRSPTAAGRGVPARRTSAVFWRRRQATPPRRSRRDCPALRPGDRRGARREGREAERLIGAAVFIPGVDFPVLTLNQLRLVLRLATAYGQQLDAQRLPEVARRRRIGLRRSERSRAARSGSSRSAAGW